MREFVFIKQNRKKWIDFEEKSMKLNSVTPDEISNIYVDIISDLSYSQTHYPDSRLTIYLNNLSRSYHDYIYNQKKTKLSNFTSFWTYELPSNIYHARKELMLSLVIFVSFLLLGVLLSFLDDNFIVATLGRNYVNMTLNNIANGTPTDVYNTTNEFTMFWMIAFNNLKVTFNIFKFGVFPIVGPSYILMNNGLMVGAFQTLFFQHGVGFESMTAIWIHGTIEISEIIIAGGAAFAVGNGLLFPGTFSRKEAFMRGAKRGIGILMASVPLIVFAAFLEGYVTRHVEAPLIIKLFVIFGSLAFIVFNYIYLPYKVGVKEKNSIKRIAITDI